LLENAYAVNASKTAICKVITENKISTGYCVDAIEGETQREEEEVSKTYLPKRVFLAV
jgi:hypothetical protein